MHSFLQTNVGQTPLLRIDCVTPFQGTEEMLIQEVCKYICNEEPDIKVAYESTQLPSFHGLLEAYLGA